MLRRHTPNYGIILFLLIGFILLVSGGLFGLLVLVEPTQAQDTNNATYVGVETCRSCHQGETRAYLETRHALALQDVQKDSTIILGDFEEGADVRTIQLPGETEARPFMADDIAYVVGSGRYVQRYLVQRGENDYLILPVEWNMVEGVWQPFELAESWPDAAYEWGPNCAQCHTVGLDTADYSWIDDGVLCETCHGPGSQHVELAETSGRTNADRDAIRAAIYNGVDAQVCGQCHSRGLNSDGIHPYPTAYHPGDGTLLEEMTLFGPDDTSHWWAAGHARQANMQFNEWLESAHANAPEDVQTSDYAADSCLECHSTDYRWTESIRALFADGTLRGHPPDAVTVETAQFGVTCLTCHNPHFAELDFYLVEEPYTLCVSCHSNTESEGRAIHHPVQEMFEGVTLLEQVEGIPSAHFTAEDGPDCQTCHMPEIPVDHEAPRASHSMAPVLPGEALNIAALQDSCTTCHEEQVDAAGMQALIDGVQTGIAERLAIARAAVTEDCGAWVKEALDIVEGDGSLGVHNYRYASALLNTVEVAIGLKSAPADFDVPLCVNATITQTREIQKAVITETTGGVPTASLILWALGGVVFLFALIALFIRGAIWQRLLSLLALVLGVTLFVSGFLLITEPPVLSATGNDSFCTVCHSPTAPRYILAGEEALPLAVDTVRMANSVHGDAREGGRFGCLDCHGETAFPHSGLPATSLTEYRLEQSQLCINCHTQDTEHYTRVLERNIAVGCADCHTAHYVRPASELDPTVLR